MNQGDPVPVPASVNARGEVAVFVDELACPVAEVRLVDTALHLRCHNGETLCLEIDAYPAEATLLSGKVMIIELSPDGDALRSRIVAVQRVRG